MDDFPLAIAVCALCRRGAAVLQRSRKSQVTEKHTYEAHSGRVSMILSARKNGRCLADLE
jgi:hypothetical protein